MSTDPQLTEHEEDLIQHVERALLAAVKESMVTANFDRIFDGLQQAASTWTYEVLAPLLAPLRTEGDHAELSRRYPKDPN